MAHLIPFHQETFRPTCLDGNDVADKPVEFDLSQVSAPDLVKIKGLIYATGGLAMLHDWNPTIQANVLDAFRAAPSLFRNGVDAVRHLTIPAALAVKAGLQSALEPTQAPETPVAVTTGAQFALIAVFVPVLAFEVAMRIAKISDEAEATRLFTAPPSGSAARPTAASGTAASATGGRKRRGTAGGETPTGR